MTARDLQTKSQVKTILIFALLGPPIAAVLLVLTVIPLPHGGGKIALTFALAIALGYRIAFIPLLVSGIVAVVLAKEMEGVWRRSAATVATAMILTCLFTLQLGRPEEDASLLMLLCYSGFAALAGLVCLAISRPGRPREDLR
ncbi:hypothetical protein EU805_13550 [Salipiger sp. IMCC34102]|uniref:hypothetical protein n=1 Tax=Salipiger sp. IMCC34102 TaxID=2510647 RepID=UPI00101D8AB2|nr:hypothetical protein [Salipiger sp. IMCC34102]RYH01675.1 hypothetical protein EU805_13550 [Salipiger sp. IMCC34102]